MDIPAHLARTLVTDPMAETYRGEVPVVDTLLESNLESVDECMVNAVVHGNRYSARKKVHFAVSKAADHLTITVRDEGAGFEYSTLPNPLSEENLLRQSGRGLLLIQAFVDRLEVTQAQPGGTEVKMVKYLGKSN